MKVTQFNFCVSRVGEKNFFNVFFLEHLTLSLMGKHVFHRIMQNGSLDLNTSWHQVISQADEHFKNLKSNFQYL